MTDREAMKLALEALNSGEGIQTGRVVWTEYDSLLVKKAITALREALAQPTQQPLTDEQISAASKGHMTRNGFARAIEAAHGIKENMSTEFLRLSKDGIWVNPDIPVDEAAKLVLAALGQNIRALVEKAVADEREACAKVIESHGPHQPYGAMFAAAIRARSEA